MALLVAGAAGCGQNVGAKDPAADKGPKTPFAPAQMAQAWKTPPATGDSVLAMLLGTWRTKTAYYVGRGTGVEIVDPATGNALGTVTPPQPDMHPCAMTEGLSKSGLGAIAWIKGDPFSPRASCDQVSLIDTRKGSGIVWTMQVAAVPVNNKPMTSDSATLSFVDGDVLAVMTPNTVVGLRPDKKVAWTWTSPGAPLYVLNTEMSARGDRITVMLSQEVTGTARWNRWVTTLDAAKGQQVNPSAVPMTVPEGGRVKLVGNDAPAALIMPDGLAHNPPPPELVVFGRDGSVARRFPLATTVGPVLLNEMSRRDPGARFNIAFDAKATTAYVAAGNSMSLTAPTSVVAYDMATGTQKWAQSVGIATTPRFLGTDADTVYVLGAKGTTDMPVRAYGGKTGTPTEIGKVETPDSLLGFSSLVVDYKDNSLVVVENGRGAVFGALAFRPSGT
ncbi:hypothetical protein [Streptomyces sp. NPDC048551]|uniref:hypothetical protein n=1 Tax=Streptomyces sp. NPDC048551 TaxID=3155758 RepID=UPI0034240F0C